MANKYSDRFIELEAQISKIESTKQYSNSRGFRNKEFVDEFLCNKWRIEVKNLLFLSCGKDSIHFKEFELAENSVDFYTKYMLFDKLKSVFYAAKDDYLGGYVESYKQLIQADIFNNELEQAEELLDKEYYVASAVIAGTVLETYLRELCKRNNIAIGKLNKMNDDLAKNGVYNNIIQKQIVALSAIRNSAAHGKKEEFTKEQVENMIVEIKSLLTRCFV